MHALIDTKNVTDGESQVEKLLLNIWGLMQVKPSYYSNVIACWLATWPDRKKDLVA